MELRQVTIKGLENYQISDTGLLFNTQKQAFRKGAPHKTGYVIYTFFRKVKKAYKAHKLVALAFIPNPDGKPCINHINGIKHDNSVSNLEWCTISENNYHSIRVLGNKPKGCFVKGNKAHKHLMCEVTKGVATGKFESFASAGRANNINGSNLLAIAKGKYKSSVFEVNIVEF